MTPERWQHIKEIYYAALGRPPGDRCAFVDSACADDEAARQEVSQLISAYEETDEFLELPAFEVMARSLAVRKPNWLSDGQIISHYKIIRPIAAGGMGEVYLANDVKLNRAVALKLLPVEVGSARDRLYRFEQEACAASALNHPNILTIYEIGDEGERHFIATEYIEGETLRERIARSVLDPQDALDIAFQIAAALGAAHKARIVHRDVKPENIMLRREDGLVKVLDFGLAKSRKKELDGAADSAATTKASVNTAPGMVLGTVAYMSPEQARGLEVDDGTDIWSLGCVLYEMVTGKVPFAGTSSNEIISAILSKERPTPLARFVLEVPERLEEIVTKALSKDKEHRYQTVSDLARDLKSLKDELEVNVRFKRLQPNESGNALAIASGGFAVIAGTSEGQLATDQVSPARPTTSIEYLVGKIRRHKTLAGGALFALIIGAIGLIYFANRNNTDSGGRSKKSIAILPLRPINMANRDEIYEIGIADSLIHRLSGVEGLVVRPLSATRKYNDVGQDPLAAGREQRVDYVLSSNYQLATGKIRVTALLFNVSSGQVEETYKTEKDAEDVFVMQDAIAGEVGDRLLEQFATTSSSPKVPRGTTNEEAYRLYLQGTYLVEKEVLADSKRAVDLFDQALTLDPSYAKAWAGKARAHCAFAHWGGSSPDAGFAKAKPALERALALDANVAEAYGVRGIISSDYDWDFAGAEKYFLRAIDLAPNADTVHRWYANRLADWGRSEDSIARIKIAIDLNPTSVFHQIWYGRTLYFARRYDDAITQLRRVVEMDSANPIIYLFLWRSYHMKGDYPRAYESFMRFQQLIGTKDDMLKSYKTCYAKSGWQGVLLRYLEIVKANDKTGGAAYNIAELSALSGQHEQSFRYLDFAVNNRSLQVSSIAGNPGLDSLRGDPRFDKLARRVGWQ
ncbi:MAG TPA: protein kinase [Pyrinomonadaceae bacterium]|nr:protein kinase [Pyrinomonadaceae bacterium]